MDRIEVLKGHGWIELTDHMGDELKIVNAARIAYNKQSETLDDNDKAILKALLTNGHTSPLEHVVFTFHVKAPIFVVRQWFRHRTWSYSELSRRYTKSEPEFYYPYYFTGKNEVDGEKVVELLMNTYAEAVNAYDQLLNAGVKAEQARMVLPVGMMTEFYGTVNLNNLLKFLGLRDDAHAQYEIQEYAKAIKQLVKPILPTVAEALKWE